jgi:hypothetical protein
MKTTQFASPLRVHCTSVKIDNRSGLSQARGRLHDGRKVVFVGETRPMTEIAAKIKRNHRAIGVWCESWQIFSISSN